VVVKVKWFRTNGRVAAQSSQSSNSAALELLFLDVSCSFKSDRCKAPGSPLCLLPASASHGIQGEWHSDKSRRLSAVGLICLDPRSTQIQHVQKLWKNAWTFKMLAFAEVCTI